MHLGDPVSWHFQSSCRDVHVWLRASVTPNFDHPFFITAARFNLQPFYCIAGAFEHCKHLAERDSYPTQMSTTEGTNVCLKESGPTDWPTRFFFFFWTSLEFSTNPKTHWSLLKHP